MIGAAKKESSLLPGLAALRLVLLLVVALCLPETRVWGFAAPPQPASGVFESASPSSIGEFTTATAYDASGSPVAANSAPRLKTVLGSGQDVAPYLNKPGYNVLEMDRTLPLATRKQINTQWLDDAIDRGDEIILKTDPIKWDRFMREIGKESFYNEVELPRLLQRGVIDDAILDY